MVRIIVAITAAALAGCAATPLKPPELAAVVAVCVKYETSDTIFEYELAASKEQTLQDLTKRIDRYLEKYLKERNITTTKGSCKHGVDAILNIRLDTIQSTVTYKRAHGFLKGGALNAINHTKLKYAMSFVSPT
jgi:hypothetical protein